MPKNKGQNHAHDTGSILKRAREGLSQAVDTQKRCVERITEQLNAKDSYDTKLASHLSYMAEGLTRVLEALRKLEGQEAKSLDGMEEHEKDQLIIDYIAELPKERRADVRQQLDDLDEAEGVL